MLQFDVHRENFVVVFVVAAVAAVVVVAVFPFLVSFLFFQLRYKKGLKIPELSDLVTVAE